MCILGDKMTIIKHGDKNIIDGKRVFVCSRCGCEFEANRKEYRVFLISDRKKEYRIECPECEYYIIQTEKRERKKRKWEMKALQNWLKD